MEKEIRTDLWNSMTLSELYEQQALLTTKLMTVSNMIDGASAAPSILSIYSALQMGLDDITKMINTQTEQSKRKK